jgi:hypothetical protein
VTYLLAILHLLLSMQPKGSSSMLPAAGAVGAIHLSNPVTGRLIAKIEAAEQADSAEHETELQQRLQQRLLVQQQQQQQQEGESRGKAAAAGDLIAQAALAGKLADCHAN